MPISIRQTLALAVFAAAAHAQAADLTVQMHAVDTTTGKGKALGSITIAESAGGLTFTPSLTGLPPGPHGFHVHMNGRCEPNEQDGKKVPAGAAGGHLDPHGTKAHQGPGKAGHTGDLPALQVAEDGSAKQPVQAPQLKTLADVKGRALMIHAGGDNYADQPAPLGGGGARIACGVIGG
ncbi:Cu-Zn family superoxide dismutase [Pseudoduganella flava]|uniref:Superoxide dismutase [Cu-Zn] n=1 Tax=Pseudoduganella flava TaxID=871742 RepID=A0A562PR60_9BURK|nr:superoxide dismutase family protein [Pseudoduganella flava]QGZ37826.1 superoxide dismutase [Cu-Zn] SodC2 [Pseudoduganella flava]TWI46650.1 Cu-Zn family superoxide dismutase [Pseudoduganella flava]